MSTNYQIKMNSDNQIRQFSQSQMQAIDSGTSLRNSLLRAVIKAVQYDSQAKHPHTYIYSPPGLGKTYNILRSVKESALPYRLLTGKNSLWSFGVNLMNIHAIKPQGSRFIVIVDDCDELLDFKHLDVMKNVLSGNRILSYQAQLNLARLDPVSRMNIVRYQTAGSLGFEVPCEDFIFIFSSNFKLPFDDQTARIQSKGTSNKAKRMNGLSALRSRFNTKDFDMDWKSQWGWIVAVVTDDDALQEYKLTQEQKFILLDWMYSNWSQMKETSVRTSLKMAQIMTDEKNYRTAWETDFLK
jgi:hypothetical protein